MDNISLFKYFGTNPEKLIGYFYSGLLSVLIISILEPGLVKDIVDTLGGALSILISLGIGIGLYTIYFQIIGEFFLFQFQRMLHSLIDAILKRKNSSQTSTTGYLGYLGVPFNKRRRAYEVLKNEFEQENHLKSTLLLSHGEIHVLYITSTFFLFASFYSYSEGYKHANAWLISGTISLAGAFISDIKQHTKETNLFKIFGEDKILKFLQSRNLV